MASLSEIVSEKKHLTAMQAPVLRLHCDALHLVSTGNKRALVDRLWEHLSHPTRSVTENTPRTHSRSSTSTDTPRTRSRSSTSTRPATLVTPRTRQRTRQRSSEADTDTSSSDSSNPEATLSSPSVAPALVNGTHDQSAPARRRHHHHSRTSRSGCRRSKGSRRSSRRHTRGHQHSHHRRRSPKVRSHGRSSHRRSRSHSSSSSGSSSASHTSESSDSSMSPQRRSSSYHTSTVPLRRSLRKKISRGEYIEFPKLLCESLVASGSHFASQMRKTPILSLDTWLEAWSLFAEVLSKHRPHLAPSLFHYQAFISRTSQRFQPSAWLQYDRQFRLKLASCHSLSWASTDPELVATWLSADAARPKRTCYSCGSTSHLSSACPSKAQQAASFTCSVCSGHGHAARDCPLVVATSGTTSHNTPATPQLPAKAHLNKPNGFPEVCEYFNRRGRCFRGRNCPRRHICLYCAGDHAQRDCTLRSR